jgi:hypothetical protein
MINNAVVRMVCRVWLKVRVRPIATVRAVGFVALVVFVAAGVMNVEWYEMMTQV